MCNCISKTNATLREHNTVLALDMTFDEGGKLKLVLPVPTKKIDSRKRGPAIKLMSTFCPFCGECSSAGEESAQ
jgi:hypothetical protein